MIFTIIRREILENIISFRFILSSVLIVLLFVFSGLFFGVDHKTVQSDYWEYTNENLSGLKDSSKSLQEVAFYKQAIWKKPSISTLFAEGHEKTLPNKYALNIFEMEYPAVVNRLSFLSSNFSNLDYEFIVSIILSLVALFLTYDSICGERENGTLRLMLSNCISRHQILLGKYFGILVTLLIPLLFGILINLIIVILCNIAPIESDFMARIIASTLVSLFYISIFILLALIVSSRMNSSASSMVVLLILWVIFVVLLPGLGTAISHMFHEIPTQAEIARKSEESFKTIFAQAHTGKFGKTAIAVNRSREVGWVNPKGYTAHWQAHEKAQDRIFQDYNQQMMSQAYHGRNTLRLSPTILYQKVSESIAGTGIDRNISLYKQIRDYQTQLRDDVILKDSEDGDSFHEFYNKKQITQWWSSISSKPTNYESIPKFQERTSSLRESLKSSIWDIGLLSLFNLGLFAAAFVSFLKYDVR